MSVKFSTIKERAKREVNISLIIDGMKFDGLESDEDIYGTIASHCEKYLPEELFHPKDVKVLDKETAVKMLNGAPSDRTELGNLIKNRVDMWDVRNVYRLIQIFPIIVPKELRERAPSHIVPYQKEDGEWYID